MPDPCNLSPAGEVMSPGTGVELADAAALFKMASPGIKEVR